MLEVQFAEELPKDPVEAVLLFCSRFKVWDKGISVKARVSRHEDYVEALAALDALFEAHGWGLELPSFVPSKRQNIDAIRSVFRRVEEEVKSSVVNGSFQTKRERYSMMFGVPFMYTFSDGDLARIQTLVNELRDLIAKSELFDRGHKERLLKRLEKLQSELHKKVSSLDKFWGLFGDAGVVLGKFGNNVKPIVDRIREITQIAWRTQARAEELASGASLPLLTSPDPKPDE